MDDESQIRKLKRQLKKTENDNRYKKIGLILQAIATIASILSLFKK